MGILHLSNIVFSRYSHAPPVDFDFLSARPPALFCFSLPCAYGGRVGFLRLPGWRDRAGRRSNALGRAQDHFFV